MYPGESHLTLSLTMDDSGDNVRCPHAFRLETWHWHVFQATPRGYMRPFKQLALFSED